MYRMFKVFVLGFVSIAHLSSLGMNRANQLPIQPRSVIRITSKAARDSAIRVTRNPEMQKALAIERAHRHFERLAENSSKTKLLEHPSFPGESLNFQSQFFSSNYMDLPKSVALPIVLMTKDVPVDQRRFVLIYHAHYRKQCKDLIESFARAALKKSELYDRQIQKVWKRPDGMEQFLSLHRMVHNDLGLRAIAYDDMLEAFHDNHYPMVLAAYQEYHNIPKSYQ